MSDRAAPGVEALVTPGCPHAGQALERVRAVVERLAPTATVEELSVETDAEAERLGYPGSPTIRVDGRDLEGRVPGPPRLACRDYDGREIPPVWLIEAGILRALDPAHILFLCVANSARSQMAEGIARSLAPEGVRISSAGSEPSTVRPEAIEALAEIGLDIRDHRSKGMDEIEGPVDAVITLCAEEVCPAWLGGACRLHWGLPDPAAVAGDAGERLQAFREVRDELWTRLGALFPGREGGRLADPPTGTR